MTCRLSIVIAVHGDTEGLDKMLDSLLEQSPSDVELLVCAGRDWDPANESCSGRARVRLLKGSALALTPHLWRDGILAATAARVALTIAQHVPAPDWVEHLLAADLERYCAVGGALDIELGASRGSCASYLLRYASYAPSGTAREVTDVAGDNVVYDREALLSHREAFADGFWEPAVHACLFAEGRRILFDPTQIVVQQAALRATDFASQRFAHGTRFGFDRAARLSGLVRVFYALAAPAAPLILGAKVCWRTWQRPELRRTLQRALPLLGVFLLAWGAGETKGAFAALRSADASRDLAAVARK